MLRSAGFVGAIAELLGGGFVGEAVEGQGVGQRAVGGLRAGSPVVARAP